MVDEESPLPPEMMRLVQDTRKVLDSLPPIPPEVIRTAQTLQPQIASLLAAMEQAAPLRNLPEVQVFLSRWRDPTDSVHQSLAPTTEDLVETDEALRTQVLPETSEEELAEAVTGIAADPGKVKLAVLLSEVIDQLTGIPGSAPWVKFVIVFWLALKLNADVVGALALAYALVQGLGG